jgi:NAD(P)-dependent dehydrogenase (short-subunit alcohol dehydrogenase family)
MTKLAGKTVLITGGNSGIGLATAKLFLAEGARLAITGRDPATLALAKQELGNVLAIRSDAADFAQIEALMREVGEKLGKLDVLFVNAGGGTAAPFARVSLAEFDEMAAINFRGVFFTIQKALPLLAPGASVIVTTSISNQVGAANFSVYAACKAALRSLVRTLSVELIESGVRVNAISPGPIDTPGFGRWGDVPKEIVEGARADFTRRVPIKRFGTGDEVARAALFLATADSSYVVGAELIVDGGFTQLL